MLPQIKKPEGVILIFFGIYLLCTILTVAIDGLNSESDAIALSNLDEKIDFILRSKFIGTWKHEDTLSLSFDKEIESPVLVSLTTKDSERYNSSSTTPFVLSIQACNGEHIDEGYWLFEKDIEPGERSYVNINLNWAIDSNSHITLVQDYSKHKISSANYRLSLQMVGVQMDNTLTTVGNLEKLRPFSSSTFRMTNECPILSRI